MVACFYTHRHTRMHFLEEAMDWLDTWTRSSRSFGHCTLPFGFYATYMQGVHIYTYLLLFFMSRQMFDVVRPSLYICEKSYTLSTSTYDGFLFHIEASYDCATLQLPNPRKPYRV